MPFYIDMHPIMSRNSLEARPSALATSPANPRQEALRGSSRVASNPNSQAIVALLVDEEALVLVCSTPSVNMGQLKSLSETSAQLSTTSNKSSKHPIVYEDPIFHNS